MGQKATQPKLYYTFSLNHAVPTDHLVRKIECSRLGPAREVMLLLVPSGTDSQVDSQEDG